MDEIVYGEENHILDEIVYGEENHIWTEPEGNAWFERNHARKEAELPVSCKLFENAIKHRLENVSAGFKILEIGCSFGYNLRYLCEKYHVEGYGIDPSPKAIEYGNSKLQKNVKLKLMQGSAENLPFECESFDIVIFGFCMYCINRKDIFKSVSEVDRVLKEGGIVAIWDFDTNIPYMRPNMHHENLWTYKYDWTKLFCCNPQYTLIEKRPFSDEGEGFTSDIQERCALNILYKEQIKDAYIAQ